MTLRVRRSGLAFGMGIGLLAVAAFVLVAPGWPPFFAAWFGAAGLVGLFLGRRTRLVAAPARPPGAVVLRPASFHLRGTPIRYFRVALVERPAGDASLRELHRMASRIDAGIRTGRVFDSAEDRTDFRDRLVLLGMEFRGRGRVVANPSTHAAARRTAVTLAARLGCPLLDLADTRPRLLGPASLRIPYFERLAAWGPLAPLPTPPHGMRVEASPDRLRITFPRATWLFVLFFLVAAWGVWLVARGSGILGPAVTFLGGLGFLLSLAVGPGAVLEVDRTAIRFRWRLPACRTKVIPIANVDVLRVLENDFAILATTGHVQMGTPAAAWLRDRIEAFVIETGWRGAGRSVAT